MQNAEAQYQSGTAALKSGKSELASQKNALASGKSQAQAEFAKQEEEIANLQNQLDSAKQQIDAAEQKLEAELANQEAPLLAAREELEQKKADFASQKEAELQALEQKKEGQLSELASFEQQVGDILTQLTQKQKEADGLKIKVDELKAAMEADPSSVTEEMNAQLISLQTKWDKSNQEISSLTDKKAELEDKKASVQEALQEIEEQIKPLNEEKNNLEQVDQTLSEQEAVFQEQAAAARKKLADELAKPKAQWESGVTALGSKDPCFRVRTFFGGISDCKRKITDCGCKKYDYGAGGKSGTGRSRTCRRTGRTGVRSERIRNTESRRRERTGGCSDKDR